jgi:hypothetical protein
MSWDWLITTLVLLIIGLAVWAKIGNQTIPELLGSLIDMIKEKKEDAQEEVISYYG